MRTKLIKWLGLFAMLAIVAFAPIAIAQTNSPPPIPVVTNVPPPIDTVIDWAGGSTTNLYVGAYMIYDTANHEFGGGIGAAYSVLDGVMMPTIRLEYLYDTIWLASGSLELRPPKTIMGRFPITPFGIAGVGTPIAGLGAENGEAVAFFGAGISTSIGKGWGLMTDAEWRFGADLDGPPVARFGFYKHF